MKVFNLICICLVDKHMRVLNIQQRFGIKIEKGIYILNNFSTIKMTS